MAVGSFINLHGILLTSGYGTDNLQGLPYGDTFRTFPWIVASVLLQTGVFIFVAWQMRRSAVAHPDPLARVVMAGGVSAVPPPARDPLDADGGDAAAGAAAGTGPALWPGSALDASTGSAASAVAPLGDLPPVVLDNEGSSVLRWFEGKLRVPMLRRDRSKELDHEPVGRLDKLDLFIVILVVVAAMALRTYRLGEPFDMHFDEVYHARTATEFLQDWRYGEPHSIYEFTHPHIAKYSIAIGLILFGDDQVTATADLGADVTDAALETRWSPADDASERDGDRLYLATGSDVRVYDLAERDLVATLPIAAQAVAVDEGSHTLFAADAGGTVWSFSTLQLDDLRRDASHALPLPTSFATLPSKADQVRSLEASDGSLIALASNGELVSLDGVTGDQTGETNVDGAAAVSRAPSASRIVVDPAQVTDVTKLATQLADILGDDPDRISALLTAATRPVTVAAYVDDATTTTLQNSIDAGTLAGTSIESGPTVAVGGTAGVTVLDTVSLDSLQTVDTDAPVTGLVLDSNCGCGDANVPTVYAASASDLVPIAIRSTGPSAGQALTMPGVIRDVYLDASSNMIHVLGLTPDGTANTVYVVETHGNAVYADARLPFDPRAVVMDIQPDRPADDRQDLLAFSATGSMASVDIGSHAFAWRLPGVIMGALMAAGIYLLARFFFRRRSIGLLAALLTLVEGMAFANSRIAMNDTYVAAFIVLALVLFVPLYLGIWKRRLAVALVLPLVGILLGLALGSKWVGAYAMGVVVLAILLRSALGRIIALVGMIGMTGVLGWLGLLADPSTADPHRDYLFLGLMVVLTVMLAVAMVRRPVRFTLDELRFVVVGPAGLGGLLVLAGLAAGPPAASASGGVQSPNGLMLAGAALLFLAALAYGATWLLARFGIGPLAPPRPTRVNDIVSSPSPEGWLRPGWFGGIPWIYALGCMIIIPLVVYVISYIPWALLPGNRILNDWPPGHNGQTLLDLTQAMYNYHNDLRAGHAASSPWWAWPLDLKPVWFYQDSFANSTTGVIYDSGNLVIFWLGIPAVIFASWQAWVRRSLPLTLIVLAMFGLWLPWARIDRATFQYHFFTSLPFVILALAYFLAELWHGASSRTFLLARVAGAIAILGPPILWLLREPLCSLAATNAIHPNGAACGPTPLSRSLDITDSTAAAIAVFVVAAIVIGELIRRQRGRSSSEPVIRFGDGASGLEVSLMVAILAVLTVAAVVIVATQFILSGAVVATMDLRADDFYVVVMLLLIGPAIYALRTRDPRRWVIAAVGSAVLWFIIWYPNLTGMPMPDSFGQAYLLLLPTWNYDFQFSVNLDAAYQGSVVVPETLWFTAAVIGICIFAMVLARGWRSGREVNPPE